MIHLLPCRSVHLYAFFVIAIHGALFTSGLVCAVAEDGAVAKDGVVAEDGAARGNVAGESVAWRVGKDFQRQLQLPGRILWSDQPLRQGLQTLAESQRIAIWLDRRVDPDRAMRIATSGESLQGALQQVAGKLDVGVGYVGDVVYLGPKPVAARLATIAALKRDATAKLPTEVRALWQRDTVFQWSALTSPRELLERLAKGFAVGGGDLRVVKTELLPHDLWAAGDYPAMPMTDQLTLLLAGFDLSFDLSRDGRAIRLAPMPEAVSISRTFKVDNALRAEQRFAREFPHVELERRGNRLVASGRFEDLELIRRLLLGETVTAMTVEGSQARYTLNVEDAAVGAIIGELERQLNLTVNRDPAITEALKSIVSFRVKEATLPELLEAALKPAGIAFQLNGTTLELQAGQQ